MMKNLNKAEVLKLKEQVEYQKGQVVSKTLAQNNSVRAVQPSSFNDVISFPLTFRLRKYLKFDKSRLP